MCTSVLDDLLVLRQCSTKDAEARCRKRERLSSLSPRPRADRNHSIKVIFFTVQAGILRRRRCDRQHIPDRTSSQCQ